MSETSCTTCAVNPKDCDVRADAMATAALVLGFNEMAKSATTLGDKVYFRLFREEAHRKLKEMPDPHGYVIVFAEPSEE